MLKIITIGIVAFLVITGIFIGTFLFKEPEIKCGDDFCSLKEDCNTCIEDCGCELDEICSDVGICKKKEVCGDEICSDLEEANRNCCEDCGCEGTTICNKITQMCQEKIIISEDVINNIVQHYLVENSLTGTIKKITDSYHGQQIIKTVSIDCKAPEEKYPCEIILFLNEEGNIIDEMRTA